MKVICVAAAFPAAVADGPCKWSTNYGGEDFECRTFEAAVCSALPKDACKSNTDCFFELGAWTPYGESAYDDWFCWDTAAWAAWSTPEGWSGCLDLDLGKSVQTRETGCKMDDDCTWVEEHKSCNTNAYALSDENKKELKCLSKTEDTCEAVSTTPPSTGAGKDSSEAAVTTAVSDESSNAVNAVAFLTVLLTVGLIL